MLPLRQKGRAVVLFWKAGFIEPFLATCCQEAAGEPLEVHDKCLQEVTGRRAGVPLRWRELAAAAKKSVPALLRT